ncbi:OmpA family protein [Bradymonas sediminis]|nr:carboxypeptidase regulatory-like domain-containing protein [Bradymonas sediminis]TDP77138.1 outer membrane protein OmpA-like peptidoglycan-associated protein [Bradymonas sediminis]
MENIDLNQSERSRKNTRLKSLILAGLLASLVAPASAMAQGLPGADALDEAPLADEQIEPEAPAASEVEMASDFDASNEVAADADADADADAVPALDEGAESARLNPGINTEGALGFHKMASAAPDKANTYRIGLLGMFSKGSDVIRQNDENEYLGARFVLQAQFLEYLSMNLGLETSNNVNTFGRPQSMLAQGDMHLGIRGHYQPAPGIYLAGDLTGFLPTGFESAGYQPSAMSVRPRMMMTADFGEFLPKTQGGQSIGLLGHFNFGYLFDNSANLLAEGAQPTRIERFAHQISGYDYLQIGLGLEYATQYVAPFVAWNLDIPVNPDDNICAPGAALGCVTEKGFAAYPDTLSLGLRAEPVQNLGLTAGVDIGLSSTDADGIPVTLPWQVVLGASWRIDPEPKIEYIETVVEKERVVRTAPQDGFILGTVTDADTGKPVENAVIRYRKPGEHTAQATNASGTFLSYGFAPGKEIVMSVSHPDYAPAEARQMIDGNGEVSLKIKLQSVNKSGKISGRIVDQDGKPVANARVKLSGAKNLEVTTDSNGQFNQELPAGSYTVGASAEDYMAGGRDVQVAADKTLQVNITLKPAPKEELVEVSGDQIRIKQKVFFATGKATILERSFDVLDQVASVMLTNPTIKKVAIEGHTDDVGDDAMNLKLSKERAQSVLDYLVKQGVSAERLSAEGFGETQPLVPNSSERTRSLNRRVEFKITQ